MPPKVTPTPYMSPAQLLRRLALSTSQDPRLVALRARLLPAAGGDVAKSTDGPGRPPGPKRRQQVTVHGKHGPYQSTRLVGTDKPAPAAAPAGKPTLVFDSVHPATGTLHGVKFASWADVPQTPEAWAQVDGQDPYLEEPPIPPLGKKTLGSGVIIREKDGRVWLVKPTGSFGGYAYTFPKGGAEQGLSLQANAIKETFEEAGLQVKITGYAGDVERDTSVARYYYGERTGGTPSDHGWESEAVVLVDPQHLHQFLNKPVDQALAHAHAGAPTPPPPPPPPKKMKPAPKAKGKSAPAGGQGALFGSKSQAPPTPPTISAFALTTKNGPAFEALLGLHQQLKAGTISAAEALPQLAAVPVTDPQSSSAAQVDIYRKLLVDFYSYYAHHLPGPSKA